MSTILEYRENALDIKNLKKGKYIIVPSTKNPGDFGKYYLSIYFNIPDKNFSINYLNPTSLDEDKYKEWNVIAEEDESQQKFSDTLKEVLSLKA